MENLDIGFKIKKLREEKNLSQEQLANLLEISQSKLSKIENGRLKKIEMKLVLKFCKNIDINLDDFFENTDAVEIEQQLTVNIYTLLSCTQKTIKLKPFYEKDLTKSPPKIGLHLPNLGNPQPKSQPHFPIWDFYNLFYLASSQIGMSKTKNDSNNPNLGR